MYTLKRSRAVPYSSAQMFELVNAVGEYPKFLPWCVGSHIVSHTTNEMIASLEVAWKGVHKHFTTRNRLTPYQKIDITLIDGPIKYMEGIWLFEERGPRICNIMLDLKYELTGGFVDRLLQPMFQHIANALVDAFCEQARVRYAVLPSS